MANPVLKVNGLDLSEYLRIQADESPALDPAAAEYFTPQFAGLGGLGDGQQWVADTTGNKELIFPLLLEGSSRTAFHALIASINQVAEVRGAQVEFTPDETSPSTFFVLERGRLDVQYEHMLTGVHLTTRAVLHLWVRPYGTTATGRLVASLPIGSSAVVEFSATGIIGDYHALANLEVRVGSAAATAGRVLMYAVHPHPSNNPYRAATSGYAQANATTIGASGAIGSQYTAIPISPTGASGVTYTEYLTPPDAHIGRHRVFAIGRSGLGGPVALYAQDRFGAVLGPTALATQTNLGKWQLIDLGEVNVPARASGQEAVPTQTVSLWGGALATTAEINASPGFHLNGLLFLPLDHAVGVMRTEGAAGETLMQDTFARMDTHSPGLIQPYESLKLEPEAELGGEWQFLAGLHGGLGLSIPASAVILPQAGQLTARGGGVYELYTPALKPNASALHALASGRLNSDISGRVKFGLTPPSGIASPYAASAAVVFYPKAITNASTIIGGVGAKFQLGPSQTVQIFSASANGATAVLASAGIASTLASGIYLGQAHNLVMQVIGGRMDVWVGTAPVGSPVLSASHANGAQVGWPVLGMNSGSQVASGYLYIDEVTLNSAVSPLPQTAARETFRLEAFPEGRIYQGNASIFTADRLSDYRGAWPQIPPVGSPMPTGPARVVVMQGEIDNIVGNDGLNVTMTTLERFRFLR